MYVSIVKILISETLKIVALTKFSEHKLDNGQQCNKVWILVSMPIDYTYIHVLQLSMYTCIGGHYYTCFGWAAQYVHNLCYGQNLVQYVFFHNPNYWLYYKCFSDHHFLIKIVMYIHPNLIIGAYYDAITRTYNV